MVGVTFLTALITAGAVGAPGVFIVPLQKEFGWTTAEISSALSIRFILFGLMAPFAAALMNRYGLRNVTLAALSIVARPACFAGDDQGLAIDAAVGRGGRHRHRHDRAGARRHRRRRAGSWRGAASWSASSPRAWPPAIGVPAAACEPYRALRLAHRAGVDVRDARRRGVRRVDADARPPERCRPAPVRRRRHGAAARAAAEQCADHGGRVRRAARCLEDAGCSGSCSRRSSSAAPAPTGWSRCI